MHNDDMQAHHNHMNLVHTHHQSRMHLVYNCYAYDDNDARTSRRDHMYKTRCYTRIGTRSRRRTWVSSRFVLHVYCTDISSRCQVLSRRVS